MKVGGGIGGPAGPPPVNEFGESSLAGTLYDAGTADGWGLTKKFVDMLTGRNGATPGERIEWLSEHAVKKLWRRDLDDWQRVRSIHALAEFREIAEPAVPTLREIIRDDSSAWVKTEAAAVLEKIQGHKDPDIALPDTASLLSSIAAAGHEASESDSLGIDDTIRAIEKLEPDSKARTFYLSSICFDEGNVETLIVELMKKNSDTAVCAGQVLQALLKTDFEIPSSAAALIRQAYHHFSNPLHRDWMVKLIGHLDEKTTEAALFWEEVIDREPWPTSHEVAWNMLLAFGSEAMPIVARRLENPRQELAVDAVGYLFSKIAQKPEDKREWLNLLIEGLQDEREEVRSNLVSGVGWLLNKLKTILKDDEIRFPLIIAVTDLLKDEKPKIRWQAANTLGYMKEPGKWALPMLALMEKEDTDESCRIAAAEAIEKIESGVL